ncbi:probable glycosyltransferase At5g03795 [Mangifera indica]|uniref:probable glycosyltransferase At5g03795 n=1 Tax=Mangifera indica TaxID=29780 RepID=UPI001CFA7BD4|nr:probable glycosyltransferase At5g03795 [Mangifera indica]
MGGGYKNCCALWSSSSSSMKKLLFVVPLIIVASGFVSILGSRTSTWVVFPNRSWSSSSSETKQNDAKKTEEMVDLQSRMVVVGLQDKEEALLNVDQLVLNKSSSPPLPVEAVHVQQSNGSVLEDGLNISVMAESPGEAPMSESVAVPTKAMRPKLLTKLEKLEAGLQRARVAIKQASNGNQTDPRDPNFVPLGPMYWDSKAFHRSYLEMEKQFKVFVYEEGEPPVFHDGPCKSIYSMEGNFIYTMEVNGQFRTKDPEKAHVFFLPFSVAKMVQFVYVRDSHDFGPIRRTVVDYVNLISSRYPYWNRSLGADHFMLACHDWGPETSFSVPYLGKNSIRALCNANTSEKFSPMRDVSFPEINLLTGKIKGLVGGPSPSRRSILAFFAGGVHGPIRPVLLEHWESKDDDIRVHKYLPKGVSYYEMMRNSKFCLCPSGYEVASPRVVEAIYTGCVPVLISEHYVPPFSDVLNWKSFSVEVSMRDIPNLKRILTSVSTRQYLRMYRRVVQVRRHFEFNSPPRRFDVFHMILHSIWLRRLNVRIHNDQSGFTN